jgi:hypothetical protein
VDGTEDRLRRLAFHKLRALDVSVFVSDGVLLGRLSIDPERLDPLPGLKLTRVQSFVVQGHDRLQFVPPTPLSFVGEIPFYDCPDLASLLQRIEQSWREAADRALRVLSRVHALSPTARLHAESWTIEAQIADERGPVHLSFRAFGDRFRVVTVDGEAVETPGDWRRGLRPIDLSAPQPQLEATVLAAVQQARREVDVRRGEPDGKRYVPEELATADLLPEPEARAPAIQVWYDDDARDTAPPVTPPPEPEPEARTPGPGHAPRFDDPWAPPGPAPASAPRADGPVIELEPLSEPGEISVSLASDSGLDAVDVLFEDAIELTVAERPARRPPRTPSVESAFLDAGAGPVQVTAWDVSAGGAFFGLPIEACPPIGDRVTLGGFGHRRILGRVVHHRDATEAGILGTPTGVGVAFEPDPGVVLEEAPAVLVMMGDGPEREQVWAAVLRAGLGLFTAEGPLAASAAFFQGPIAVVVFDTKGVEGGWARLAATLDLAERRVPAVVVGGEPGVETRGAHRLSVEAIGAGALEGLLPRRKAG